MDFARDETKMINSAVIDRYPGKMVCHLAERIVTRYRYQAKALLDPYCGSGGLLRVAMRFGIPVSGLDVNPYAILLSEVKLNGFRKSLAQKKLQQIIELARSGRYSLPISWTMKNYWFTPRTLEKYESLRGAAKQMQLQRSQSGKAVILALALSVRRCSRADQRSPKPFISKLAISSRKGKHFDPISETERIFGLLAKSYSKEQKQKAYLVCDDITNPTLQAKFSYFTHIITSPPYVNAQDYFRNWKIELYLLEGLLPFRTDELRNKFIGSECGVSALHLTSEEWDEHIRLVPHLEKVFQKSRHLALVIHKYLYEMNLSFQSIEKLLIRDGKFVIVCGDNLIAGYKINTSYILNKMLELRGFHLIDQFKDRIRFRQLSPKRYGHKGLIKEEIISVFTK